MEGLRGRTVSWTIRSRVRDTVRTTLSLAAAGEERSVCVRVCANAKKCKGADRWCTALGWPPSVQQGQ
ncbi:unnamed protein product [Clonostachys rosea]|uniref:Uncharacterized protein n=1 Tax=Bionectria ochroleuca TaxID=29856 RepID=A0ABY6V6J1_BIOOC|nr:unnamed protein product [Clonostachys rosea]